MSVYVIYIDKGAKKMRPITTEEEYRALRGAQRQENLLFRARQGDKKAKSMLLQFNYSCHPKKDGLLKGSTQASNTVGMDVDFSPEDWAKEQQSHKVRDGILAKKADLGLMMLERSATKGYHLVFGRQPQMSQVDNLRWASRLIGVPFDEGAKDITRVFFTTTNKEDELLYLDPKIFDLGLPEKDAEREQRQEAPTDKGIVVQVDKEEEAEEQPTGEENLQREPLPRQYDGLPYSLIIDKWWEMHYEGKTPVRANRNTRIFELAKHLRHICGFNPELLDQIIPCYDDFDEAEKMACIRNAVNSEQTQMPKKLQEVLDALKVEQAEIQKIMKNAEGGETHDNAYYAERLPKGARPMGVRESLNAAAPSMTMPILTAICPIIGGLATHVSLTIHNNTNTLNLMSYICGEAGSGKGSIDPIVAAWCKELQEQDDQYHTQHNAWRTKYKAAKNKKEQPEEPKLPIRMLTLNNTLANLAERLANVQGMHCISFTPEADTVSQKWKSSMSDFSVMIRQAYDASRYEREARSAEAVSVQIPALRWNVVMCGTIDALYRVVTNYTDGLLSRMAIARTSDNTFQRLDDSIRALTPEQAERIRQVAHLLPLMRGEVEMLRLEARSRQWVEFIRLEAMKNDDRPMARCRLRDHVTAYRMTACLILCEVAGMMIKRYGLDGAEQELKKDPECWKKLIVQAQTPALLDAYSLIANSLIENDLYFFRHKLERAYAEEIMEIDSEEARDNATIYEMLNEEFDIKEARECSLKKKGAGCTPNQVRKMLYNWKNQGLVVMLSHGHYRKSRQKI